MVRRRGASNFPNTPRGWLCRPQRKPEDIMGAKRRQQDQRVTICRRGSPETFAALIERFHNPGTSEEEAHGLLTRLTKNESRFWFSPAPSEEFVQVTAFLCSVGHEVNVHPSVVTSEGLRRHARIILARHILGDAKATNVHHDPFEEAKRDETYAIVYRFYAASREHCWLNESDRTKVRAFFTPHGGGRRDAGDPRAFAQALINLQLSDILEEREAIYAIPLLYAELGVFQALGYDHTPALLSWEGWREIEAGWRTRNIEKIFTARFAPRCACESTPTIAALEHDLNCCTRRAAAVLELCIAQRDANDPAYNDAICKARTLLTLVAYTLRMYHGLRMHHDRDAKAHLRAHDHSGAAT